MNSKKASLYIIVVSLIAAAAIMLSSYLWKESYQTIMYIIIAIWFVPFLWLSTYATGKKAKDESQETDS